MGCCLYNELLPTIDIGLEFEQCQGCGALKLPQDLLVHQSVDPDSQEASILLKLLFTFREMWLRSVLPSFRRREIRILDVGCGDGQFLEYLRSRNYCSLTGVEVELRRRTVAKNRGLPVFASIDELLSHEGSFDLIFVWHVLEHVDEPAEFLRTLLPFLAPTGRIVVSVPNHRSWQTRLAKKHSAFLDYGRHIWYFDKRYFNELMSQMNEIAVVRLPDLNFEYEVFGWVDSIASLLMRRVNYIHLSLKKGHGGLAQKVIALVLTSALLPISAILSGASLASRNGGSTLTYEIRYKEQSPPSQP